MKRKPGWRAALAAALIFEPTRKFSWGNHDCFIGLVVPAVLAMTGVDLGADFRGKYDSADGARTVLAGAGFADLAAAAASLFPEIAVSQAHIGDIAVVESKSEGLGVGLGIVTGERIMVLTEMGHGTVRLTSAIKAFKVG